MNPRALALAVVLLAAPLTSCTVFGSDCESMPLPMFHYRGVTYLPTTMDDSLTSADLGDVIAEQKDDMPHGLVRCEKVKLKDGQGSLAPGSKVYAITGIDPADAIAVDFGNGYLELHPSTP